jgi:hypothetical protein
MPEFNETEFNESEFNAPATSEQIWTSSYSAFFSQGGMGGGTL